MIWMLWKWDRLLNQFYLIMVVLESIWKFFSCQKLNKSHRVAVDRFEQPLPWFLSISSFEVINDRSHVLQNAITRSIFITKKDILVFVFYHCETVCDPKIPKMTLLRLKWPENSPVNHFRKEVITNFDILNRFVSRFNPVRHLMSNIWGSYSP